MIRERFEDGKRIISLKTAEEFGQVLADQEDNYRVEIEAPEEVIEAFGIMDSAEELAAILTMTGCRRRPTKEPGGTEVEGGNWNSRTEKGNVKW